MPATIRRIFSPARVAINQLRMTNEKPSIRKSLIRRSVEIGRSLQISRFSEFNLPQTIVKSQPEILAGADSSSASGLIQPFQYWYRAKENFYVRGEEFIAP